MTKKKRFDPNYDFAGLVFFSLLLLTLVLVAYYKQAHPEWKRYQKEFKIYVENTAGPEAASALDIAVKQIWLPDMNRVDRCVTCHLGYDNPNLSEAPQPFRSHPDIEPHSLGQIGCTICHGGQGFAVKKDDAHGEVEHWIEPLLGKKLAEDYGIEDGNALIQINCNICHRHDMDVPGMERINTAKRLMLEKTRCQTCHVIDGAGGKISSDLTYIGEKPAERFDFSQIEDTLLESGRPLSMLSWHFEHFKNPSKVVPGSKMPAAGYTDEEAMSLAMLMISWRPVNLPVMFIPKGKREAIPEIDAGPESGEMSSADWGRELFTAKNCAECHTIGEGVEVGPDLQGIFERRDRTWLIKMILEPEAMEESDSIAKKLYAEYGEIGMPTEPLSREEAEAILNYIESHKNPGSKESD